MEKEIKIIKGYKYRIYPNKVQKELLDHQMFIYNQAYNICLNLQKEQWEKNKDLISKDRTYLKASQIDKTVKLALNKRELPFKTVVTQQARINADKALKSALSVKARGFPKFKNSKLSKQSFNWNNQGFSIKPTNNPKNVIFTIMKERIKLILHRDLPSNAKIKAITISKENNQYFVSFNLEYQTIVSEISKDNLDISEAIGIDLNINDIALSNKELIKTNSKEYSKDKYSKAFKLLQKKQSRRVLKSKKDKIKLGSNFKRTQNKLNKIFNKAKNLPTDRCQAKRRREKKDKYHKITSELVNRFDMIVVEDLKNKNMTKSAKGTKENHGKNVKQKSGLNKSILNTSFYQIISMLEYKAKHNGKLFCKVPPQYTSKTCSNCGKINPYLTLKDRQYLCECGNNMHRDINASINILNRGLSLFGLGTSLADLKEQSLSNSETLVSAS